MMFKQNLKMKKLLYSSLVLSTIVVYAGDHENDIEAIKAMLESSVDSSMLQELKKHQV